MHRHHLASLQLQDPVAASAKASPKHSGGIKDKSFKGSKGSGGDRMSKKNGSSGLNGTSADGDASGHRQQDSPACRGPRAATASPHAPCSPQHPHTGPLGIAAATAAAAATLTPTNGNSSIGPYSIAPNIMRAEGAIGAAGGTAAGGLATPGGGLNPNGSAVSRERKDSSKPLSQVSTVSGPDVQGELGVMARELRATVKDIAVRLDDVIGSGTFGVVFRGACGRGYGPMWAQVWAQVWMYAGTDVGSSAGGAGRAGLGQSAVR